MPPTKQHFNNDESGSIAAVSHNRRSTSSQQRFANVIATGKPLITQRWECLVRSVVGSKLGLLDGNATTVATLNAYAFPWVLWAARTVALAPNAALTLDWPWMRLAITVLGPTDRF